MLNYESNIFGIEITNKYGSLVARGLHISEPGQSYYGQWDLVNHLGKTPIHVDYFKSLEALKYRALSIYLESRE